MFALGRIPSTLLSPLHNRGAYHDLSLREQHRIGVCWTGAVCELVASRRRQARKNGICGGRPEDLVLRPTPWGLVQNHCTRHFQSQGDVCFVAVYSPLSLSMRSNAARRRVSGKKNRSFSIESSTDIMSEKLYVINICDYLTSFWSEGLEYLPEDSHEFRRRHDVGVPCFNRRCATFR